MTDDQTPLPDVASDPTLAATAATTLPKAIGRYEIRAVLGAGGMGVVYRAWDPQLARDVALKVVRDASDADGAPRLLREARAMAKVRHANVIAVHDAGETPDGAVFVVMELVDAGTLAAWFATAPAWRDVLARGRAAGEGLAAAHAVGLVHRDFKPHNVLLDGATPRVLVADFGLARTQPSTSDATSALTATGAMVGTPAYMAPEQLLGEAVGAAADQYALAVTLFEGLYGARPFAAANLAALVALHLESRIAAPPADTPVPPAIHAVLVRALARRPEARWPDVTAMLAALAAATSSRDPMPAPVPARAAPSRSHLATRGVQIAGLAIVALAAIVGVVAIAGHGAPTPHASAAPETANPAPVIAFAHLPLDDRSVPRDKARAWAADAELLNLRFVGTIAADGTMDVTAPDNYASWVYVRPLALQTTVHGRCDYYEYAKDGALTTSAGTNTNCGTFAPAGEPRCTLVAVLARARAAGVDPTQRMDIAFAVQPHRGAKPVWMIQQHRVAVPAFVVDDCDGADRGAR